MLNGKGNSEFLFLQNIDDDFYFCLGYVKLEKKLGSLQNKRKSR